MFDAMTAINQLTQSNNGVNRLSVMIGAKNFVKGENYIVFKFAGKAKNKANHFKITYTPDDLYTVEMIKIRGVNLEVISKVEGMYCEDLKEYFESETGLYLSL